jgi:hypothetical protein
MVALTSTETNTIFGIHWPGEPRAAFRPRNELLTRLVGEEAPQELIRDGVNHPSMEASYLTIAGKFMLHTTSLEKKR